MAKKKKKKKKVQQPTFPVYEPPTEGRYYWCVNCGHHGDYGKVRKRGLTCELCNYDEVSIYTLEEINDPFLDNVWLERFQTKDKVDKGVEKETPAQRDARTESNSKSTKMNKESVLDKIAKIRGTNNDNKRKERV